MPNPGTIHIVIPDTQSKPDVPTEHLAWVGQYIVDQFVDKPSVSIIHLGDHADMPSLSSYDRGKREMEGRRYRADIEAANSAFDVLCAPLEDHNRRHPRKPWEPTKHILLGNHEDRIDRACSDNAQLDGTIGTHDLNYADHGWTVHPFLKVVMLDGVAYSHYFYNPMSGNVFGGMIETRLRNIGRSFTMGHQQTLLYGVRYVAGRSQHGLVAGACYLHDEDYKGPQGNAHWRGIIVCHEVEGGSYDPMFVSLRYLCQRYEGRTLTDFVARHPQLRRLRAAR